MVVQIRAGRETFATDLTHVRFHSAVDTPMRDDVQGICKSNYLFVRHTMVVQVGAGGEAFSTDLTHVRLLLWIRLCVMMYRVRVKVITFSCVMRWYSTSNLNFDNSILFYLANFPFYSILFCIFYSVFYSILLYNFPLCSILYSIL